LEKRLEKGFVAILQR